MHIWGEVSGFQIEDVTEDYEHLCTRIRERKPQLLLLEPDAENPDMIILEEIKREKLCKAVAMVSVFPDFKTVRKCFLLGAYHRNRQPLFLLSLSQNGMFCYSKIALTICYKH